MGKIIEYEYQTTQKSIASDSSRQSKDQASQYHENIPLPLVQRRPLGMRHRVEVHCSEIKQ